MSRARYSLIVIASLLAAVACGELKTLPTEPEPDPVDPTATFSRVRSEILTPDCAQFGCHDIIGQQEGLILSPGQAYANVVNRPSRQIPSLNLVTPGDFANSYLYRKVAGVNHVGDRMPQLSPPLTAAEIQLIRDWIRRGAPND